MPDSEHGSEIRGDEIGEGVLILSKLYQGEKAMSWIVNGCKNCIAMDYYLARFDQKTKYVCCKATSDDKTA